MFSNYDTFFNTTTAYSFDQYNGTYPILVQASPHGESSNDTLLVQWVTDFLQGNVSSACYGPLEGADPSLGENYCDKLLMPKVLSIHR
mmetsp:Transcript_135284/g.432501  ORF Transcript_135284/g.432501 Transcript_135284/m.432501 type:complete len:88 (-) Transcript_135284:129-392(-)